MELNVSEKETNGGIMHKLCEYIADAGSCVINGINIENGFGDGEFNVYYSSDGVPEGALLVPGVYIDLRNEYDVIVNGYDCDVCGKEDFGRYRFTKDDFPGADALQVAVLGGDIIFVKYF